MPSATITVTSPGRRALSPTLPETGGGRTNVIPGAVVPDSRLIPGEAPEEPEITLRLMPSAVTETVGIPPTAASTL